MFGRLPLRPRRGGDPRRAAWRGAIDGALGAMLDGRQRATTPRGPGGDDGEGSHHRGVDGLEGWSWMDVCDVLFLRLFWGVFLFVETD